MLACLFTYLCVGVFLSVYVYVLPPPKPGWGLRIVCGMHSAQSPLSRGLMVCLGNTVMF